MDSPGGLECVAIMGVALHPVGDLQSTGAVLYLYHMLV